jgi:nucleotidyltransferase AbiEii toxin of type IV toxin-antitoxin system
VIDHWTIGGGTAMMLQIDHRESHDVDIFLNDPQQLPFLDPQRRDFKFEIQPDDYEGDGIRSLKLVFSVGEIDFVVAGALTSSPTIQREIEGELFSWKLSLRSWLRRSFIGAPISCPAMYSILRQPVKEVRM